MSRRGVLAAAGCVGLLEPLAASAQVLEQVVVTGTRIRGVDAATTAPVQVFERDEIERSGAVTFGPLLQASPANAGAATNPQVNNTFDDTHGTGSSTISLRGVGANRTLVLVNGRRWISDDGAVDVNSIPINLIERVEILKGGASAIYGSDAIGGVVNFITRKAFDGFEVSALRGESSRNDGELENYQLTLGAGGDSGHAVIGLTYDQRDPVSAVDRPFSKDAVQLFNGEQVPGGSSVTDTGRYTVPRSVAVAGGADLSSPFCAGSSANVVLTRREDRPGTAISDYRCFIPEGPGNDRYDFMDANLVLTPQERYGAFIIGERLFVQSTTGFLEGVYHSTQARFQIAPEPFASAGLPISPDNLYNPFGTAAGNSAELTDVRLRLVDAGNRVGSADSDRFQISVGMEGNLKSWHWAAAYTWGELRRDTSATGALYRPALGPGLGPSFRDASGTPRCGVPGAPIADCVPIDFFGVPQTPAEIAESRAALAALVPERHGRVEQNLRIASLATDGPLFELPAGDVLMAAGLEYRRDSLLDEPDLLEQNALLTGIRASRSDGALSVREAYVETVVPIVKELPALRSLSLTAGARYSDYDLFGTTSNATAGLRWKPLDELLIRATYSEVFRAPTVSDLFEGRHTGGEGYLDPCNRLTQDDLAANPFAAAACQNVPFDGSFRQSSFETAVLVGGNPALSPEEGTVMSSGLVWTADFASRFTVAADLWWIDLDRTIGALGAFRILQHCFDTGQLCHLHTRDANGDVAQVIDITQNGGAIDARGVDVSLAYQLPENAAGRFSLQFDGTYLHDWTVEIIEGDPGTATQMAGQFWDVDQFGSGHFTRVRAWGAIEWARGQLGAGVSARYIGDVYEVPFDVGLQEEVIREIDDQVILNLQGTWRSALGFEVTAGVDNLTDELAPLIYSTFSGFTDGRTYDAVGRFYYLRLGFKPGRR